MRSLALALLALSAFAWTPPFLDRAGTLALGLAFLALALPSRPRRTMRLPGRQAQRPAILNEDGRLDPSRLDEVLNAGKLK